MNMFCFFNQLILADDNFNHTYSTIFLTRQNEWMNDPCCNYHNFLLLMETHIMHAHAADSLLFFILLIN
jgi:hypothetical protein